MDVGIGPFDLGGPYVLFSTMPLRDRGPNLALVWGALPYLGTRESGEGTRGRRRGSLVMLYSAMAGYDSGGQGIDPPRSSPVFE